MAFNLDTKTKSYFTGTYTPPTVEKADIKSEPVNTVLSADNLGTKTTPPPTTPPAPKNLNIDSALTSILSQVNTLQKGVNTIKTEESKPNYAQSILDLSRDNLSDEKQQVRDESGITEKEAFARQLGDEIMLRDQEFKKQLEELEKNKEGKLTGALQGEINNFQRERSREMADRAIAYNIANGDYLAAQTAVDARIKDMEADRDREIRGFELAFNFAQNDMSESEQLAAQQAFSEKQAAQSVLDNKELAQYRHDLDAPQRALDSQLKNIQIAQANAELDALKNPPSGTSATTLKAIDGLSDGSRASLTDANDTIRSLTRMNELIASTDFNTLATIATVEGREFNKLAQDVADKMARERTGAVVSESEEKSFKKILGLTILNRAISDKEEIIKTLGLQINKHTETVSLIDPTGEIRGFLNGGTQTASSYLDTVVQGIEGGVYGAYVNNN